MFESPRTIRRALALCTSAALVAPFAPVARAAAATFEQITDDSVWLKEDGSGTCTLTAAAMMVRRAALLNGDPLWRTINNNTLRAAGAWLPGLLWNFTVSGVTVSHAYLSAGNHASQLINLLSAHPEGVVIYKSTYYPHAVLLVDYSDGTFWCADPAQGKLVPLEECYHVTLENLTDYWYVTSAVAAPDDHELKVDSGWHQVGNSWYVYDDEGMPLEGLWEDDETGVTYYFDDGGKMARGWRCVDGDWYYFQPSGAMQTGWSAQGSHWYLFGEDGVMVTGWHTEPDGASYYFNDDGSMRRGWLCDGGSWYYFQPSGIMLSGWQVLGKAWYHFDTETGAMAVGLFDDTDGARYVFDADGRMVNGGWYNLEGTWYYLNPSGIMARSTWIGSYYVQDDGTMATNTYVDGGLHVGADGLIDGSVRAN